MRHPIRLIAVLFLLISLDARSQTRQLSDEQMLKGAKADITRPLPQMLGWVDDNHFLINRVTLPDTAARTMLVDCKTGKESPGSPDMLKKPAMPSRNVYLKDDDVFIREAEQPEQRLTQTNAKEKNPVLSPDNKYVAFTRDNNLYTIELASKKESQLTTDGSDVVLNGYASWVYYEEILGRASRYRSYWWSPDSKHIAFMRMDETRVPIFPIYSEVGQHGFLENTRYPQPGDPNPEVRIGMVSPDGGATTWADFNAKDDQLFGMPYWRADGQALWVLWMNRDQNNLKIYEVAGTDGTKKQIYDEKQKTWVDLGDGAGRIRFLSDNKGFLILSDQEGWSNIYWYNMDGSLHNKVTNDAFWGTTIMKIDDARGLIWFSARKENSARTDLYKASLDGKVVQRLTFGEYTHRVDLSPNGAYFLTTHSNVTTPDKLTLVDGKGKIVREIADSKGADFDSYILAKTEMVRVKSDDGLYDLPMRITWPLNYDPSKSYPVMINIYGGPNAGTVRDGWQYSGQTQWWAKEGLIQVSMDHRASGHFGKNGLNYMYKNLGYWEMKDWITCVKWLRAHGADSTRVGIAGFSYGGYMTCYALTYGADYFTHGLAGGSVTDWALYDDVYTERFMGTPQNNPEGYKSSAVMTYADKYKGLIRIYHGTMDDNVHMQNSIQLAKKFQELKKHFEYMVYPGARHGWGGVQSMHSTNENNLFIYKNLLRKDMPAVMFK